MVRAWRSWRGIAVADKVHTSNGLRVTPVATSGMAIYQMVGSRYIPVPRSRRIRRMTGLALGLGKTKVPGAWRRL